MAGIIRPISKGHHTVRGSRAFCLYSVYDNKTDFPIIVDATAEECAKILKRTKKNFYCLVNKTRRGKNNKYTIMYRFVDEEDEECVTIN